MHAGLSIESIGTLERQYNKGPRDWQNCSLYRGLPCIEICCIEVPLYLLGDQNIIRVISERKKERKKERFRRATKRDKFSRAA